MTKLRGFRISVKKGLCFPALAHDKTYADKNACRVSELSQDLGELLPGLVQSLQAKLHKTSTQRLAYHSPCTSWRGQKMQKN